MLWVQRMKPVRSYLIHALYKWMVDNTWSPHFVVDALYPGTDVPENFVQNGEIVLDASPHAINKMDMGDKHICFQARFNEEVYEVFLPIFSIKAIYSKENGRGMIFDDDEDEGSPVDDIHPEESQSKQGKSGEKKSADKAKKRSIFRIIRD
jgi:stringent starvation protein B